MTSEMRTMSPATSRTSVGWLVSVGVAALAVAAVTIVAQSTGRFHWWAGFILLPGALIAATGGPLLTRGGGGRSFTGYLVVWVGGHVFAVGAILMFGAMGRCWPLMIVLPTLAVAGTYLWRPVHPLARALHRTIACLALAGAAVGGTLQLLVADVVDFGQTAWWGGFMMLAGVIMLLNGLELLRHRIDYRVSALTLIAGPAVISFLLGLQFLRGWPY
ncbi:hypothetical protein [Micromonospora polyrhachis]|uniref:Uncharacterized protein n=1 Tax=Micromonospora polyrhachis TaxID=1282883 RepID=A0A7W7WR68_9ACTN|nr:hypothetical protein [Micromonospora polyrhachis]MBB4960018.1 hypothetical protein [Micromonospora polyrhachis]